MSAPPSPGPNRTLLYGVGAGCGCLSLIIGIVAVVLVVGALSRAPSGPSPQPAPQPQPGPGPIQPRPQPPEPQPGGDVEGTDDLKIGGAHTLRIVGQPPNITPGEPATTFTRGEAVGFRGVVALIRGTHEIRILWVKLEGGTRVTPVAQGKFSWSEATHQGKPFLAFVHGTEQAPPGDYAVGVIKVVGEQNVLIVRRGFTFR
ncbi:MAG: hypothetical protein QN159_03785 [Armatimonadota bacterium]|nr:hypothetical protein [Armatimonadota bacterium]